MNVIINKLLDFRSIVYLCFIKLRNELCVGITGHRGKSFEILAIYNFAS